MRARKASRWAVPAVVLGAFLAGMAVRGLASPGSAAPVGGADTTSPPRHEGVPATEASRPGPLRFESGVPVGYARTREGAVAAAVSFMATGEALLGMSPVEVRAAVRAMATGDAEGALLAETTSRLAAARAALAGTDAPVEYRQAAVAVRVDSFDRERARVAVWNVGVLSREGVAPPQAGWAVSTFDLAWERGDWKVAAETIEPGPAPVTNEAVAPASAAELRSRLAGFVPFGGRP
ncbi:MAG: hypothetical protein AB1679_14635 [Actinomycetota bacterium]